MKKSYKTTIGVFALAAIALVGSQMVVSAHQGENNTQRGQGYTQEHRATMTKIFANKDYQSWKAQMQNRGHISADMLTPKTFAQMSQMHQKMQAGDYEGARAIRDELKLGVGRGMGQNRGMGQHNNQNRGQGEWQGQREYSGIQNMGGNFVDVDNDGMCDHMN